MADIDASASLAAIGSLYARGDITGVRLTQQYAEVITTGDPASQFVRLTQQFAEVITSGIPADQKVRLTQQYAEVILALDRARLTQQYIEAVTSGDPADQETRLSQQYIEVVSSGDPADQKVRLTDQYIEILHNWPEVIVDGAALFSALAALVIDATFVASPAFLTQRHFRLRTDALEVDADPTWAADQDNDSFYPSEQPFRVRFAARNDGHTQTGSVAWELRVSKNGGAYTPVTTTSQGVKSYDAGASADGAVISISRLGA